MRKRWMIWTALCLAGSLLGGCGQAPSGEAQSKKPVQYGEAVQDETAEESAPGEEEAGQSESGQPEEKGENNDMSQYGSMKVDTGTVYQTMESFGTSGAWWSQYVGGFEECVDDSGISTRERIATLLFDKEEGIGLTCYRYNLGAGSAESRKGTYSDVHRRARNFETSAGVYDFTKDANAVWFLEKATELGVEEVVLFCNSPLERLTDNGLAHMDKGAKSNLSPENYRAFASYVMDVAEHFVAEGIPVKVLSPINEPQWEWTGGQEGTHYEPEQLTEVYLAFLDELESREALEGVKLSGPESGEWKGQAIAHTESLLGNERLAAHFDTIDNHSYWSEAVDKESYRNYMKVYHPEVKLRTSEWCEMVNGSDVTMDSAIHLAQEIAEDLRILSVVSWQNWVAVAPGGYRDGLIYIDEKSQKFRALKRLWSFGNYSRYVRPGYVRVEIEGDSRDLEKLLPTAFTGTNENGEEELVMVFVNEGMSDQEFVLEGCGAYDRIACYETSDAHDLECVLDEKWEQTPVTVPARSVVTLVLCRNQK